jgi:prepilin-type processing-associated H-X9-DG protein
VALCRRPADKSRGRALQPQGKQRAMARKRSRSTNGNFGGRSREVRVVLRQEKGPFNLSQVFLFADEVNGSTDDGQFLVWPNPDTRWVNLPAGRHGRAGVVCFADGRVETSRWRTAKWFGPKRSYWKVAATAAELRELHRLEVATLPKTDFIPQSGHNPVQP